jgi:hypothetical protein
VPSQHGEHDRADEVEDEVGAGALVQRPELGGGIRDEDEHGAEYLNNLIHRASVAVLPGSPDTARGSPFAETMKEGRLRRPSRPHRIGAPAPESAWPPPTPPIRDDAVVAPPGSTNAFASVELERHADSTVSEADFRLR